MPQDHLLLPREENPCDPCIPAVPLQVYAVAAANISLGFTITGVPTGSITPAAQNALGQAASEMAGV
jgi:hypothetical protein